MVRNIGGMSEVLEDFSPVQLDTSGTIDGRGFTVVGRSSRAVVTVRPGTAGNLCRCCSGA